MAADAIDELKRELPELSDYTAIHYLINHESFRLSDTTQEKIESIEQKNKFNPTKTQAEEILHRYSRIKHIMQLGRIRTRSFAKIIVYRKAG